jgi:glucokinase
MTDLILALDFGGTKLTAGVVDVADLGSGRLVWRGHERLFGAVGGAVAVWAGLVGLGRRLLGGVRPLAVGVSFGGPADYETGVVRLSHHVPGWEGVPLAALLAAEFGAPVRIDNDANVAALGEWRFGAGRGVADMLYVTVSTGVGGGWILGGRPFRGHGGMAGEIGHVMVDPQGPVCLCGKRGCVERLASGPYMAQDLAALTGEAGLTGLDVAERAAAGVDTAVQILRRGAWALGVGIGNAANLLNMQRVVLGGGVTKAGADWWRVVRQTARATALPEVQFEVVAADFTDDAPLWGAVGLVIGDR